MDLIRGGEAISYGGEKCVIFVAHGLDLFCKCKIY